MKPCTNILVIFTCHNRALQTEHCIKSLADQNHHAIFKFIVVDDNSTDETVPRLKQLRQTYDIDLLHGDGTLYYSGGMRCGMEYAKNKLDLSAYPHVLLINDDVSFFEHAIDHMLLSPHLSMADTVLVGATKDQQDHLSYGGVKYLSRFYMRYRKVGIQETSLECDSFNGNCVLIPMQIFLHVPSMDSHYIHLFGDFDYGLSISKKGYRIIVYQEYAGLCNNNSVAGTMYDTTLSKIERIRKKEQVKGVPFKIWFYFIKKNFGIIRAIIFSITPYIKLLFT